MSPVLEVVRTRRIEICRTDGDCAMSLDCDGDEAPTIRLYDPQGLERLVLTLNQRGQPQVGLLDVQGKTIVGIGINDEMGCGLNLFDGAGDLKVVVLIDPTGKAVLKTFG